MIAHQQLLLISLISAINAQLSPDCKVVQAIYTALNGVLDQGSSECCNIAGTRCTTGKVVRIDWRNRGLHGSILPIIGDLRHLRGLSLSGNQLHGNIPRDIVKLRRLKTLDIDVEQFCGDVPLPLKRFTGNRKTSGSCFKRVPEPPTDISEPEPPTDNSEPEPPTDISEPEPPTEIVVPVPPADISDPEPPTEILMPEPPADISDPEPPTEILMPEPPAEIVMPELPFGGKIEQQLSELTQVVPSESIKVEDQSPELSQEEEDDNSRDNTLTDDPVVGNDSTGDNKKNYKMYGYGLDGSQAQTNEGEVLGGVYLLSVLGKQLLFMQQE